MNKISKRLSSIISFVNKDDRVADVGCDHGLLSIYLYKNKLCKSVIASDINKNALSNAINNIELENASIKTYLSDGIKNIPDNLFDTLVISGMGTSTILHILEDDKRLDNIKKLILQSNNEHSVLRSVLNKKGFYLSDENVIYEGKKYYITMKFEHCSNTNTKKEIKYGLLKEDKKEYYQYLIKTNEDILRKIPKKRVWLRLKYKRIIKDLNKLYKKTN
ncbi:MAG: class I SAM-dependent methyltransferase [Bacilli bacterium]